MPHRRLAVHQRLHGHELTARAALHQIAGDGERAAAEADHGLVRPQLPPHDPYRLEDRRHRLFRLGDAQRGHVRGGRHRPRDHRADVLDQVDLDSHPEDGKHDVSEHHRRVDAVAADRLERHLGAELRVADDVEQPVRPPQLAVLGERAPRLAHEPDRRPLDTLTPRRAHEQGLRHSRLA